ncbi:transcriptional regulator, IclR family [Ectopseudomonas composti]|jgi:DNA-binding IclR family transcriptional regulator|uniref:Transcriptional regulator, IclR family n=1 Tax=Ectopseudomonas composti TaxID=658457 RepID=A0A1I5LVI6_9GAMM|nr:IclR family transcriptional regulator [Pseudomonas composti]SFP01242.1 transcriptional regulator, IclR family [Pseudomonas composti]
MSTSVRDRALSILELLVKHVGGLPMSEIADRLDIPRTATHRLLNELKDMGYVKQNAATTHYLLTVKLASLGLTYLAASGITDATQPLLDELAQETGELIRMAVIEGNHLIWVAKAQGARTGLRYDPDAGSDVYLPATANGLAWMAAESEERALELIAEQGMDRAQHMGPNAPKSLRELLDRIDQTHKRGYGVVHDVYEPGTSAVAVVIRHVDDGRPIGTVSAAGPSARMTAEKIEAITPRLQDCAKRLAALSLVSPAFNTR